jgi:hypothetical protein
VRRGWLVNARVLRGGSFINNNRNARCAYRNNNDNLNNNRGFRVVASHFSLFEWIRPKARLGFPIARNAVRLWMCSRGTTGEKAQSRPGWAFSFFINGR